MGFQVRRGPSCGCTLRMTRDPRITPDQRARKDFTNSRAIIDACRPFHWRDQFPMVNIPSKEPHAETREKFSWVLDEPED